MKVPSIKHFITPAILLASLTSASAVGFLEVRAPGYDFQSAEYTTTHVFVDEVAGTTVPIEILFNLDGFSNITDVEIFTNLNRRDLARVDKDGDGYADGIQPIDGNVITDSPADADTETGHYYGVINMTDGDSNNIWELTIPAGKTGAYRLTARFKTSDSISENEFDPNKWIWYGLRDHAIVVSPVDARDIRLYEINVFNIEATDGTFANRSTLEDLHNASGATHNANNRWDLGYLKSLGMNWLWFQPIHPNGIDGREPSGGWDTATAPYDPGSPYAVKNFFEVNALMTINYDGLKTTFDSNPINPTIHPDNRAAAMTAFQNFVTAADTDEVGIMLDAPFNHTAFDVELAQQGVDLFQPDGQTWSPLDEIRDRDARFFSQDGNYGNRAFSAASIAAGPDRFDFGKWRDVKDVFFGRYDALVEFDSEPERSSYTNEGDWFDFSDSDWTSNDFTQNGEQWNITRRVWDYFAEYAIHWLEKTRPAGENRNSTSSDGDLATRYAWDARGIDGLRCDFGQGLPPRAWEYMINVARSYKWNFVMMSESLDGGAVTYRSNRHFDILNENIVFPLKSATTKFAYRSIFDDRRTAYGQGLVLLNNTSHDEANFSDPWQAVVRSAVTGMMDGTTMIFPGQELGISETYGYDHYELNFGKNIPHFKRWNSMQPIWNDTNFGNDQLYPVYSGIQNARAFSPALRSSNRWFLDGDGDNDKIFSVAKYEEAGASPAVQDVVIGFANVDRDNTQSDNFKIPSALASLIGIKDGRTYNVRNIAAYTAQQSNRRDLFQWGSGISGADIKANGFFVELYGVPTDDPTWTTNPYEAQYLKLYDVTPPPATGQPFAENMKTWVVGDSVTFNWDNGSLTEDDVITDYRITVGTSPGGNDVTDGVSTGGNQYYTATASEGQTLYASIVPVSAAGISGSASTMSAAVRTLATNGDEDFDGQTNADEETSGTDPLDAGSVLRMGQSETAVGGGIILKWTGVLGITYSIQYRSHLVDGDWVTVDTVAGIDGTQTWEDTNLTRAALDAKFYRVIIATTEP